MIGFAIMCLAMYAILLGTMYAPPALFLTILGALVLPLFGVNAEFGWTLFGQSAALVFCARFFYTWFYCPPGKQIMFPVITITKKKPVRQVPTPPDRRQDCGGDGRNMSVDEHIAEGIDMLAKLG